MFRFLIKLFVFLVPFFILFILGFYYEPKEGGLIRLSYSLSEGKYLEWPINNEIKNVPECGNTRDIIIFGDSFLGDPESTSFVEYSRQLSCAILFNHHQFIENNSLTIALSAKDTIEKLIGKHPDVIFLQTVERDLEYLLKTFRTISKPSEKETNSKTGEYGNEKADPFKKINDGVGVLAAMLNVPVKKSQRRVHNWKAKNLPLLQSNQLLTYHRDFDNRRLHYNAAEINAALDSALFLLQKTYPQSSIQLLIIPDKLTIYEDYLTQQPEKRSILEILDWDKQYLKINLYETLQLLVKNDRQEAYIYSGSHFGEEGAKACAKEIDKFLQKELVPM